MSIIDEVQGDLSFLLVDDNADFLGLIEPMVRERYPDARIERAETGELALNTLVHSSFDVLLLDYRLPDFDGIEVLGEIRKHLVDVAVVMVTGEGDERLAADIFRMGAYDYLVKGEIDRPVLVRCLDQVLMRRLLERQISAKSDELVRSSRELSERTRALDTAYEKIRLKKEELRELSNNLEETVQERTGELRKTTRFLNKVLDATVDHFILSAGSDGTIRTFNSGAERSFGRGAIDMVGKVHFRELFAELTADVALDDLVGRTLEEGSIQEELTGVGGEGMHFPSEVTLSRLPLEDHEDGLVILGTDVTHEQQLERQNQAYIRQIEMANEDLRLKNEQILEATRLKSEFLANVSHELRTPLNAVIGYSDLLSGGIYGPMQPKQQSAVEGIGTRAKDLLTLINEILDLAKIESGKMVLRVEGFGLAEVLVDVLETGRVLAVDKPLEVTWVHEGRDVGLTTDRQKLQQILVNLVSNAVKFTNEGHVRLHSSVQGFDVVIAVRDSGIGIPEEELMSIFDEFRQVDGTSTREYGGTGLGLAISSKFAESMGGDLVARSELGQGSEFVLRIPMHASVVDPPRDGRVPVALSVPGQGLDLAAITGD
ncbi:MAG: response regulator [Proteobacteria bacterium]|nr:response regulator [Pseudomonadota bacterium]